MADVKKGLAFAKVMKQASDEAEAALAAERAAKKASKLEAALEAKQAPMTTPQGTGLPLMPRDQGMYTPGVEQKDLPRMPMVDKARAAGKQPKYTERMQDLLDSPTARKKVNTLIEKGKDLGMTEWYGTEPLRQVAMDIGMTQREFDAFMAQMASASQRNPVDQQNRMGSYLWHLSQTGQLPEDAFLLTNKIKRGKQEAPKGTAIELPPGYGSLAQGDIFSRGKQIAAGDIEGALPPDKKLGTFLRNLQGNLRPVTVDVNAVRGPVIERGDPRWLASKLVEKDEEGNVIATHFPRKDVESGKLSLKEAKDRPGFWEAAPSGSEYAGFEDLWQRAAKRHGVAPAEAQALGWYGSADVTALKTKPELYIDNLERMIRRTAEQTGQSPRKVMEDVLRGKQYLKKRGGAVSKVKATRDKDYEGAYHDAMAAEINKASGGAIKPLQWKAEGGAMKSLPWKAAQGGMVPNMNIDNTMPDSSDGGLINYAPKFNGGGVADKASRLMSNASPMHKMARIGVDALEAMLRKHREQPGYDSEQGAANADAAVRHVRNAMRRGVGLKPFDVPFDAEKALGPITEESMAQGFAGGGEVDQSNLGGEGMDKAKLMAEILARMAKEQGKEEVGSLKKPRALTDLINRGMIAPLVGAPVDLINMGLEGVDALRGAVTGKPVENRLASDKPFLGSEHLKDVMNRTNVTSGEDRPMMETGLSLVSPAGVVKGVVKGTTKAGQAGQKVAGALNEIANTNLNKSGKLSSPLTEAKTASTGTPQGATYATKQEGPFFRVRPSAADPSKAKGSGTREATGLPTEGPVQAGSGDVRGGLPQRYPTEEVDRIIADPTLNEPLQIAQRYTREKLGTEFTAPDIPPSSLAKQSAIARTHELALTDDPAYKAAVFDAYAREMPDVLEQSGAKNYDDLMEKAYRQLAKETDQQFRALPFNLSYHRSGEGNYSGTRELLEDVHGNKHMYVYQGGDPHDFLNRVDDATGLNENEKFRAVHDAMGHAIYGNEFGPLGEEKAWAIHQQMYSPLARLAMTAETRGQNSLVNYSPLNVNLKDEVSKLRELQIEARRRGDKEGERVATEAIRDAFSGFQFAPQKAILLPPEFVNPQYKGGMPDYIQPLVTPQAGTTTKSALTHFSHDPGLRVTDPTRYGTGIKGAEMARLQNTDNPIIPRTYFYAGEPGLVPPEPGLGVNRYRTESESLYDISSDPLRFRPLAREANRTPFTAKYNAGMRSPDQELTDMERMIREYGYEGYINPKASKPAAVIYTPKQVERRRHGGLTLMKK